MDNIGFLFDLDGVIIDSENTYTRIWDEIEQTFPTGIDNFPYVIKGTTLDSILDNYFNKPEDRAGVIAMIEEKENEMTYDYICGSDEFLLELKRRKLPTALFTSSNELKMSHLWAQHPEMKELYDVIITADKVYHSKPDPEGYILAARSLNADPRKCAVFEDSLQGVKAGRNAGAFVVGMAGTLPAEKIAPYCDIVVTSLKELDLDKLIKILSER